MAAYLANISKVSPVVAPNILRYGKNQLKLNSFFMENIVFNRMSKLSKIDLLTPLDFD